MEDGKIEKLWEEFRKYWGESNLERGESLEEIIFDRKINPLFRKRALEMYLPIEIYIRPLPENLKSQQDHDFISWVVEAIKKSFPEVVANKDINSLRRFDRYHDFILGELFPLLDNEERQDLLKWLCQLWVQNLDWKDEERNGDNSLRGRIMKYALSYVEKRKPEEKETPLSFFQRKNVSSQELRFANQHKAQDAFSRVALEEIFLAIKEDERKKNEEGYQYKNILGILAEIMYSERHHDAYINRGFENSCYLKGIKFFLTVADKSTPILMDNIAIVASEIAKYDKETGWSLIKHNFEVDPDRIKLSLIAYHISHEEENLLSDHIRGVEFLLNEFSELRESDLGEFLTIKITALRGEIAAEEAKEAAEEAKEAAEEKKEEEKESIRKEKLKKVLEAMKQK